MYVHDSTFIAFINVRHKPAVTVSIKQLQHVMSPCSGKTKANSSVTRGSNKYVCSSEDSASRMSAFMYKELIILFNTGHIFEVFCRNV